MALIVTKMENNSSDLYTNIKQKIEENEIDTWTIDDDGDFTHSTEQWNCKAWMYQYEPKSGDDIQPNQLVFGIIGNKQIKMTKYLYALYHGRFSEMLLAHFDDEITEIQITSQKTKYDLF